MVESSETESAVLITISDLQVDYVTVGSPKIVVIDWDDYTVDTVRNFMPVDIREKIAEVEALPEDMPWRTDTIKRLTEFLVLVESDVREKVS